MRLYDQCITHIIFSEKKTLDDQPIRGTQRHLTATDSTSEFITIDHKLEKKTVLRF